MKRSLICLLAGLALATALGSEDAVKWLDGAKLPLSGRAFPDAPGLERLPARLEGVVSAADFEMRMNPAGLALRFVTNSKKLRFRWSLKWDLLGIGGMPPSGVSGIDVYARAPGGAWRQVRCLFPHGTNSVDLAEDVAWTPGDECLAYLPPYNALSKLLVGLDADAAVKDPPPWRGAKRPVVAYGHSITQGGYASRPGMIWAARLGRQLDVDVVNLGFSGSGLMEIEWARVLGTLDAAAFLIDTVDNMTVEQIRSRNVPFIRELHRLRPATPIVVLADTCIHSPARVDPINAASRAAYDEIVKADPSAKAWLRYVTTAELVPDSECTVDGCHLNDWGMVSVANALAPILRPLLGLGRAPWACKTGAE